MSTEPTGAQRQHIALVERAFQFHVGRDIEGLLQLYDPNVVVTAPDFTDAGRFHGHEGFMEWLSEWNEAWGLFDVEIQEIEAVGEGHVVASVLVTGSAAGGEPRKQLTYWVADIRGLLCVHLDVLVSERDAFDLAHGRESHSS
jgi:ketosteroid isomerase-like protein